VRKPVEPEVRVLVVGDDPLARGGLMVVLGERPGVAVAGQRAAAEEVGAAAAELRAAVVVWDLGAGAHEGTGAPELRDLAAEGPPIVALAADEGAASDALAAGARAVLGREAGAGALVAAIHAAARGLFVVDDTFAALLPARAPAAPAGGIGDAPEALTPREVEVLQLLAQGLPNKLIGQRLGISEHTAKFHVNAILGKLGVQSRTEAVVRAARLGLVIL